MDLLKYPSQSKMTQASRNGVGVGVKIQFLEFLGHKVPYGMSWHSPIEGEVGKSAHDIYPCSSSCAKPSEASSLFR